MTFEVPVSAVSRSRAPRGVVVVAVAALLIVVIAIAAAVAAPGAPGGQRQPLLAAAPADAASADPAGPVEDRITTIPTPRFEPASFNRPLPTAIDCHDLAGPQCRRLVRAALRILPDDLPTVGRAEAWSSIVCNDNFDCPPTYLADALPAGSVLIAFTDGSRAVTVNVVDWRHGPSIRLGLRAWLIPMT